MKQKLPERRRFVRIETPLKVIISSTGRVDEVLTKNISPVGLRFEIGNKIDEASSFKMQLFLPAKEDPIDLDGKVVWQTKTTLEDNAPYDVGVEIVRIEDKSKNIFLKYLCDLLYGSTYKERT